MKTPPAELAERLWDLGDRVLAVGNDVRVDQLAELTGVPRATLYYYFSGKDDVIAFLLAQKLERGTTAVAEAARGSGSAAQRLDLVLQAMLAFMGEHGTLCTRLLGSMAGEGFDGQFMAEAERTLLAPVRDLILEASATGELSIADPAETTFALMGAISMAATMHILKGDFDATAVAGRLVPQLLDGLRPRS